jgi:VIT1/CCC1 family predicted Fe2+/Mn2+ transporter
LIAMVASPVAARVPVTLVAAMVALLLLGGWSATLGGAPLRPAIVRVGIGGLAAMGLTMGVGALFGAVG